MSSTFSKLKKKHNNIDHMYGVKFPTASNKHYYPYHKKLQKRRARINNDYQFALLDIGKDDCIEIEIGINKNKYAIDDDYMIDELKDCTE